MLRGGLADAVDRLNRNADRSNPSDGDGEATIVFRDGDGELIGTEPVTRGISILSACQQANIDLDHFCGGQCSCGTCRIIVISGAENITRIEPKEELVLGAENQAKGCRLACQGRILGPVEFQIPRWF